MKEITAINKLAKNKKRRILRVAKNKNYNFKSSKLVLSDMKSLIFIDKSGTLYCRSKSNYTIIILKNSDKFIVSKCLKVISYQLNNPNFFRIYASYLINLDFLKQIEKSSIKRVKLKNDIYLPIANSRYNKLISCLQI